MVANGKQFGLYERLTSKSTSLEQINRRVITF